MPPVEKPDKRCCRWINCLTSNDVRAGGSPTKAIVAFDAGGNEVGVKKGGVSAPLYIGVVLA